MSIKHNYIFSFEPSTTCFTLINKPSSGFTRKQSFNAQHAYRNVQNWDCNLWQLEFIKFNYYHIVLKPSDITFITHMKACVVAVHHTGLKCSNQEY